MGKSMAHGIKKTSHCKPIVIRKVRDGVIMPPFSLLPLMGKPLCNSVILKDCKKIAVSMCVCVYALPPIGFFRLRDICDICEKFGSTIFCCEHFLGASAKFLHLYLRIYLISPPKTKTPAVLLLERKQYDIIRPAKR